MRMANYGLVIYLDNTYEAIRTTANPGISDKYNRGSGVCLLVVIPYEWVTMFKETLDYIPVGRDQGDDLVYDAAMAWISGKTLIPYAHRRKIGRD